jgi:hypothetical protein
VTERLYESLLLLFKKVSLSLLLCHHKEKRQKNKTIDLKTTIGKAYIFRRGKDCCSDFGQNKCPFDD